MQNCSIYEIIIKIVYNGQRPVYKRDDCIEWLIYNCAANTMPIHLLDVMGPGTMDDNNANHNGHC